MYFKAIYDDLLYWGVYPRKSYENKEKLSIANQHFLEEIPFEPTGRKCNGKWVIKKTPFSMPEFITTEPFSTLKDGKKSIELYCEEIQNLELKFYYLLEKDKIVCLLCNLFYFF